MAADAFRELRRRKSQREILAQVLELVGEELAFFSRRAQAGPLNDSEELQASALAVRKGRLEASLRETDERLGELEGVTRG